MRGLHSKWNVELEAAWVWACLTTDTRDEGIANGHGPCWTEGELYGFTAYAREFLLKLEARVPRGARCMSHSVNNDAKS